MTINNIIIFRISTDECNWSLIVGTSFFFSNGNLNHLLADVWSKIQENQLWRWREHINGRYASRSYVWSCYSFQGNVKFFQAERFKPMWKQKFFLILANTYCIELKEPMILRPFAAQGTDYEFQLFCCFSPDMRTLFDSVITLPFASTNQIGNGNDTFKFTSSQLKLLWQQCHLLYNAVRLPT